MGNQGLHQVQKQAQTLVLAPQLRQSLKILQAPALELRNAILEELQQNPTLEELPIEGISIDEKTQDTSSAADESDSSRNDDLNFSEQDYSALTRISEDYRDYYAQENASTQYTSEDAERRQHFFDSLVSETSLQEHLMRQAELVDLTANERKAIEFLIGSLDDRGFLTSSLRDIALLADLPLRDVQRTAEILRTLDPPGIGCENLRDCLLTQLRVQGRGSSLAATIVREHFDQLLRRKSPVLAKRTGAPLQDVEEALQEIGSLDPAPGRRFSADTNRIIEPDVSVEKDGAEWSIQLNNDHIPRLRISNFYKQIIASSAVRGEDREYLREKIRSGKFLINSIEQRQSTIKRITEVILDFQRDFFESGPSKLKPLTMNQVAQEVGVHETTVSRAIANKFIETPHGIFEFKYFFTPGYTGQNGSSVSNTSVKGRIAQIIDSENDAKPYSDQDIVDILSEEDIRIARRTVAKYREELGILPTSLRRRY